MQRECVRATMCVRVTIIINFYCGKIASSWTSAWTALGQVKGGGIRLFVAKKFFMMLRF